MMRMMMMMMMMKQILWTFVGTVLIRRFSRVPKIYIIKQKQEKCIHLIGNREAEQRHCFCYQDSTIPLLPDTKIQAFGHLQQMYSLVCVKHRILFVGFLTLRLICKLSLQGCHLLISCSRLTICRMRNRWFSKDIRAMNFRFRKEDPQKVNKTTVTVVTSARRLDRHFSVLKYYIDILIESAD